MFKLAAFFALAGVAFAAPHDGSLAPLFDGKIVGGKDVKISDYPHQVSLLFNGEHGCSGSIIGKKHIVTAAHCMDQVELAEVEVRVGSVQSEKGGTVVKVAKIHQHPKFNNSTLDYDIAVLVLAKELTLGTNVGIIKLPKADQDVPVGTQATVTGWGMLNENGVAAKKLRGVTIPIISFADCKKAYGGNRVTNRMICAGYLGKGGKDSCEGDSGGPLIVKKVLQGIVSWGEGCATRKYPGVYANVANLRSFIKKVSGI